MCEQGNLQVFYKELPLSIQDGYERFLTSNTISLQQYQVRPVVQHEHSVEVEHGAALV